MENTLACLFISALILVGSISGIVIGKSDAFNKMIERCQKENNVYACKVIAVPVDEKGQKHE